MSTFSTVSTQLNIDTVAHYSQLCLHKLKLIYTLNVDTVANSSQDTVENNELIIMSLLSVSDTVAQSSQDTVENLSNCVYTIELILCV